MKNNKITTNTIFQSNDECWANAKKKLGKKSIVHRFLEIIIKKTESIL